MPNAWMVRAGQGGYLFDEFQQKRCVAVGWVELEDLSGVTSRDELRRRMLKARPEDKPGQTQQSVAQVAAFLMGIKTGDHVVTYNPETREYLVGVVTGPYRFEPNRVSDYRHVRSVDWKGRISRDGLSVESRNSLGAIQAVFSIGESIWQEIERLVSGEEPHPSTTTQNEEMDSIREDVLARSHEFIKDQVQALAWDDMQRLVAGILRAMGYKTRVSAAGSDRGKDIIASPDGLGLEQPRIRVEVKHRPREQMGAPEVRSFLGALRQNDKGLYVSTGGFTREAHYEAERATIPATLIDLDELVSLLVQNYDALDPETRALAPLVRVYWPAS